MTTKLIKIPALASLVKIVNDGTAHMIAIRNDLDKTQKAMGIALGVLIANKALYRATFANFDEFCQETFGFSRQWAHELVAFSEDRLSNILDNQHQFTILRPYSVKQQDAAILEAGGDLGKLQGICDKFDLKEIQDEEADDELIVPATSIIVPEEPWRLKTFIRALNRALAVLDPCIDVSDSLEVGVMRLLKMAERGREG